MHNVSIAYTQAMELKQLITDLGGPSAVARAIGVRPQAVSLWIIAGKAPLERVPDLLSLAEKKGLALTAHDLRPDYAWPRA